MSVDAHCTLVCCCCSRTVFDTPEEDPSYFPLPEEQAGEFWQDQGGDGGEPNDQGQ